MINFLNWLLSDSFKDPADIVVKTSLIVGILLLFITSVGYILFYGNLISFIIFIKVVFVLPGVYYYLKRN